MKRKYLFALTVFLFGIIVSAYEAAYAADSVKTLMPSEVEKIIKEYVIRNTPWTEEQVTIKNINISNKMTIPVSWNYHITPAPGSALVGRSSFLLEITGADNSAQSSWVSAEIEVWVEVVLASKPLKERQMVNVDDVYIGRKELSRLPAGYLDDIKEVSGKRVKRFAGANSILTENILEEPPLFKRGDKVFIIAESEALKVTAMGLAGEDGYRGRSVRITNMQSRKEVVGEVVDDGTVSVRW